MNRQRQRQEQVIERERKQFKEQVSHGLKEIQELKRQRVLVAERMQVCGARDESYFALCVSRIGTTRL